jgi:putative transposase
MGRAPRIEYEGALYHVMSRGNRQEAIFLDDRDRGCFLDTVGEACGRTGWRIHAYVLMGNHYHLLLETPEPNLVDGMRWLQGTYTKRFNLRHKLWGHLLQGRYKALVIDPKDEYFRTVGDYIHLNPARARCFDPQEPLESFPWSSYPAYLEPSFRFDWLEVNRLLGARGFGDDAHGRSLDEEAMRFRFKQVLGSQNPSDFDEEWKCIRRGWAYGDEAFKGSLQTNIEARTKGHVRNSYSGDAIKTHDQHAAEKLLGWGLSGLGIAAEDLPSMRKSDPRKKAIAWLIRVNTSVRNQWISEKLFMGTPTNLSRFNQEVEHANSGPLHSLKTKLQYNRTDT